MLNPPTPTRLVCPACGRFLAVVEGSYLECPPCSCGMQTTIRVTGKRLVPPGCSRVARALETK